MKLLLIIAVLTASLISGCYTGITGHVIDAETQQPIEGAVVLVEWTKTHGIGHTWTESYKVVEAVSDREGQVKIEGCNSPFVNPPEVTIYKKGYVAWNSEAISQGPARTDFQWGSYVFKLSPFQPEFSYDKHTFFIHNAIHLGLGKNKSGMTDAYSWEEEALKDKEKDTKSKGNVT